MLDLKLTAVYIYLSVQGDNSVPWGPDPDTVSHWKTESVKKTCCPVEHRFPVV